MNSDNKDLWINSFQSYCKVEVRKFIEEHQVTYILDSKYSPEVVERQPYVLTHIKDRMKQGMANGIGETLIGMYPDSYIEVDEKGSWNNTLKHKFKCYCFSEKELEAFVESLFK
jgi:hypothetical protein